MLILGLMTAYCPVFEPPDFPLTVVVTSSGHGYGTCMARCSLRSSFTRFRLSENWKGSVAGLLLK